MKLATIKVATVTNNGKIKAVGKENARYVNSKKMSRDNFRFLPIW